MKRGHATSLFRSKGAAAALGSGALVAAMLVAPTAAVAAPTYVSDPASYVNTLSGTGSGGGTVGSINNFPGPSVPFGMMQFSPDNPGTGQGYAYDNSTLRGFGLNHASQGCGAFGDIPILPTTQSVAAADHPWETTNSYDHQGEVGQPGYYKLLSSDSNKTPITSELTASTRTGLAAFTFPAQTASPKVFVRSGVSNTGSTSAGAVKIDPATGLVTGWTKSGNFCGKNNHYQVYFAMKFQQQFSGYGAWDENTGAVTAGDGTHAAATSDTKAGGYLTFPAGTTAVRLEVAISYVSTDNAIQNMTTEAPKVDATTFAKVRQQAHDQWNAALSKIQVSKAPSADLTTFYDSLYRSLLHPNTFNDVNGQYIGFETKPVVHTVGETVGPHPHRSQQVQYANYSDWDTYRTLAPLLAMFFPKQASDQAQSLVNDAVQSGSYPRWAFANASTNQMSGDNAVALIAQTYAFGARDFDARTALQYMVRGAQASTYTGGTNDQAVERPGSDLYQRLHYAPQVKQFQADHAVAGASVTEEWSIDDFGIGSLAAALGDRTTARTFQKRSNYWQNLFNPTTGYISPRDVTGAFPAGNGLDIPEDFGYRGHVDGFGEVGYDEGNAEQYLWLVPQNVDSLVTALGGRAAVAKRLDAFNTHGLNVGPGPDMPYMWAGNEPNFQTPWLYNYVGRPWRTQEVVDQIRTTLFGPGPNNSEPGNDDLGAQSSWYVWAALGLFPTTPGTDVMTVNTPAFDHSLLHLGNHRTLEVDANGATSGRRYTAGLSYSTGARAQKLDQTYLPSAVLAHGGTLTFTTAAAPNTTWATRAAAAPPSFGAGSAALAANATPSTSTVAPGGAASVDVAVQRLAKTAQAYRVTSTSPQSGIRVSGATGAQRLDPTGKGIVHLTISVASTVPSGYYDVPITATAGGARASTKATIHVAAAGSLSAAATIVGTSPEDAPSGNFDGAGNSYSKDQLATLGLTPGATKTLANGTVLTWPSAPTGRPETIVPNGQTIVLDKPASTISFVGAGTNGGGQDSATVTYDDGTTDATADFSFGDWVIPSNDGNLADGTLAPAYGNTTVGWTPVRNASSDVPGAYVFATRPFTAPAGRKIVSVTLPTAGNERLFTIATE